MNTEQLMTAADLAAMFRLSRAEIYRHSTRPLDRLVLRPEMVDAEDLAAGLANTCRFGCRVRRFYSVAQHLVQCSWMVREEWALTMLLHDAEEAFVGGDIPRPEKQHPLFSDIVARQEANRAVILQYFGLPPVLPDYVHEVDGRMMVTEARALLPRKTVLSGFDFRPYDGVRIDPWLPDEARGQWLLRLRQLTGSLGDTRPRRPRQEQFGGES